MRSKLEYEDLTPEERDYLTDGCGNKFLNVPDFDFGECCRRHDFGYWQGHSKEDRLRIDKEWYADMIKASRKYGFVRRYMLKIAAMVYYRAVRAASWRFFNFSDRYLTREDLRLEMEE